MAGAFSSALARVQLGFSDLQLHADANQLASRAGGRSRLLPDHRTLGLFIRQVALGNIACAAVRHLAGQDFSDSAWCQARARLPIELIERVNGRSVDQALNEVERDAASVAPRWRGHRVFILDGTNDSMPDTPELRQHYGVPPPSRQGLGFPTSHLLLRVDHRSGLILDCIDGPNRRSDLADTPQVHARLEPGDVVLADDYFSGYAQIALIVQAEAHVVMPVHHKRLVDFTPGRESAHPRRGKSAGRKGKPRSRVVRVLGKDDQIVEYPKPVRRPAWLSDAQWQRVPETLRVREIRRTIRRAGFRPIVVTIVTSLLDAEAYPADDLVELRLTRWLVETSLRHLKTTLGMDVLKCKTLAGVRKERMIFILVYNLIRQLMIRAAAARGVSIHRISFADTLAWLRLAQPSTATSDPPPRLIVNPIRPGRAQPRSIKRSPTKFPLMTKPRSLLKAQLLATHSHAG